MFKVHPLYSCRCRKLSISSTTLGSDKYYQISVLIRYPGGGYFVVSLLVPSLLAKSRSLEGPNSLAHQGVQLEGGLAVPGGVC